MRKFYKSPTNYVGNKYRLLKQIHPLFPENIDTFVELFMGGFNVGLNVDAKKYIANDKLYHLIDLFNYFKSNKKEEIIKYMDDKIKEFELSKHNEDGFRKFRDYYNKNKTENILNIYILVLHSFNYQFRFNSKGDYNNTFGRERSEFNSTIRKNLDYFIDYIQKKDIMFLNKDFREIDLSNLSENDFVYSDSPYCLANAIYVDGMSSYMSWNKKDSIDLMNTMDTLNDKGIKFALSEVVEHKGKTFDELLEWGSKYKIIDLNYNYDYCVHNTKNRKSGTKTREVLIINY